MEINNNHGSKKEFSIEAAYKFAIKTIDKNLLSIIGLGLLYSVLLYVIQPIFNKIALFQSKIELLPKSPVIPVALGILFLFTLLIPILYKLSLQFYDNNWGCFRHRLLAVFREPKKFLKALAISFIYLFIPIVILTIINAFLTLSVMYFQKPSFITPRIIAYFIGIGLWIYFTITYFLTYFFSIPLALDTDYTIRQAFERSAQLTKGIKFKLIGFIGSTILWLVVYYAIAAALLMLIFILLGNLGITSTNALEQIIGNIMNLSGLMLIALAYVSAYRQLVPSTAPAHKLCECDLNFKNLFRKKQ